MMVAHHMTLDEDHQDDSDKMHWSQMNVHVL